MPPDRPLRAVLLGLQGVGADFLAAILDNDQFDLLAVADSNADLVRNAQDRFGVAGFEDYRSIIVESARRGLDVVFVSLKPFRSCEILQFAATLGIAVFHTTPFARSIAEAREMIARFTTAGSELSVCRSWWWEPAFSRLHNLSEWIGRVHAATVEVRINESRKGWRGDSAKAGGGVLLNGAYEQIDMLTVMFGVPEDVYAHCILATDAEGVRNHDTEDVACVVLRYAHDRTAALTVSNGFGEAGWCATLDGAEGVVRVTPDALTLTARGARPLTFRSRSKQSVAPAIQVFAESTLAGEPYARSNAGDHLETLAVIEAAYLSAKTRCPELPSQFLGESSFA